MQITDAEYRRYGIDFLYHITHVENMRSIRDGGILSHNAAHQSGLVAEDISNRGANRHRSTKEAFGRPLHDYVPLFFSHKGPFLYAQRSRRDSVAILCLDKELLCREGTIFGDGNAANGPTEFFDDVRHLNRLKWEIIRAGWWVKNEPGKQTRYLDRMRIVAAEVLVPDYVPFRDIQRIVVRTGEARRNLENTLWQGIIGESGAKRPEIEVQPRWYFDA